MDNSFYFGNNNVQNIYRKVRYCWFCEKECVRFVSICDICKIDRKLVKIDKNISLKT